MNGNNQFQEAGTQYVFPLDVHEAFAEVTQVYIEALHEGMHAAAAALKPGGAMTVVFPRALEALLEKSTQEVANAIDAYQRQIKPTREHRTVMVRMVPRCPEGRTPKDGREIDELIDMLTLHARERLLEESADFADELSTNPVGAVRRLFSEFIAGACFAIAEAGGTIGLEGYDKRPL